MKISKLIAKVKKQIKAKFAKYAVIDECGTYIPVWTIEEGYEWLPSAGKRAFIVETRFQTWIVRRIQQG